MQAKLPNQCESEMHLSSAAHWRRRQIGLYAQFGNREFGSMNVFLLLSAGLSAPFVARRCSMAYHLGCCFSFSAAAAGGRAGGRAGGTLSRPIGLFGGKTKKKKKALSVGWLAVVSEMLLLLLPFLYSIAIERESSEYKKASK
jgi:hypothetical protein